MNSINVFVKFLNGNNLKFKATYVWEIYYKISNKINTPIHMFRLIFNRTNFNNYGLETELLNISGKDIIIYYLLNLVTHPLISPLIHYNSIIVEQAVKKKILGETIEKYNDRIKNINNLIDKLQN